MTCQDWRDKLTDYLEGALPPQEMRQLEAHLGECPACAEDLAGFRAVVAAARGLERVAPPEGLLAQIGAALDAADEQQGVASAGREVGHRRWSWQTVGALAVAACLLMGFVAVFQHGLVSRSLKRTEDASFATEQARVPEMAAERPIPEASMGGPRPSEAMQEPADEYLMAEGAVGAEREAEPARATTPGPQPPPFGDAAGAARAPRDKSARRAKWPRVPESASPPPQPTLPAKPEPAADHGPAGGEMSADVTRPVEEAPTAEAGRGLAGGMFARGMSGASRTGVPNKAAARLPGMAAGMGMPGGDTGASRYRGPAGPGGSSLGAAVKTAPDAEPKLVYGPGQPEGVGTLSSPQPGTPAEPAVAAGVRLNFVPPKSREVGRAAVAAVVLEADVEVDDAVVKVTAMDRLQLTNASPSGVVYSGRLRAGQRTTVAVGMMAQEAGRQQLRITVRSRVPQANADVEVDVDGFTAPLDATMPMKPTADAAARGDVSLVFGETEIREAILAVGRQAGVRVDVDEGVGGQRVNAQLQQVPAEAALRILAEEGGYRLEGDSGGYRVTKP